MVHWWPKNTFLYTLAGYCNAPSVFFTLSGFLITSILLKDRLKSEKTGVNKLLVYVNFFAKRALRLFPGYFLILGIWYFTRPGSEPINFKYYLTFTSNIYTYRIQQWPALAHLWSMAVEEQFYFIWPWVILFTNRKYLGYVITLFIGMGLISEKLTSDNAFSAMLTTNCLNALAGGALLGWLTITHSPLLSKIYTPVSIAAVASLAILLCQAIFHRLYFIQDTTLATIITIWIILFFVRKPESGSYLFAFVLDNKQLMHIGKISYGIYLFHFILPYYTYHFLQPFNAFLGLPPVSYDQDYVLIFENFVLLIGISALSYRYFEQPILTLKKYFKMPDAKNHPDLTNILKETGVTTADSGNYHEHGVSNGDGI
ncbi:acyltransferase [Mucilaginibacter sp. RS28]|uniref:Acyltransferase n=2 Tax=Mucilaginibacter straminoryzae TaxID=2932774 RepID=A0A9X1X0K0_9SPHI|nr:acyltransferase [Mucilaginibacter straminoryzae]